MFRFTIRELVLLTVMVAMGVGWWVDRNRLRHLNAEAVAMLKSRLKMMVSQLIDARQDAESAWRAVRSKYHNRPLD